MGIWNPAVPSIAGHRLRTDRRASLPLQSTCAHQDKGTEVPFAVPESCAAPPTPTPTPGARLFHGMGWPRPSCPVSWLCHSSRTGDGTTTDTLGYLVVEARVFSPLVEGLKSFDHAGLLTIFGC